MKFIKSKKNIFFLGVALTVIVVVISYNYIYKSHRSIATETPLFVLKGSEWILEFSKNNVGATTKYLDKTIQVSGTVTSIEAQSNALAIDVGVYCYFDEIDLNDGWLRKKVVIQGRCIGFDELLGEIKMDQCTFVKTTD